MSTAPAYDIQKQYYIIDASGNYFRQDGEGQLVVARTREEAFTFYGSEVMEKLGSGKKAPFYRAVPIDQYGMNGIDNGTNGNIMDLQAKGAPYVLTHTSQPKNCI